MMKNKLTRWIIVSQQPFTVVEEPNFIEFVHSLRPTALIPSADTVKRDISKLYETNIKKLRNFFQQIPGRISFTTDIWTSQSAKSFLSLTAHFINKKWKLQNVIVDFIQIYGSHTGENIKNTFVSGLESASIGDKVIFNFFCFIFILKYLFIILYNKFL